MKVSVVIPFYNLERYVRPCLDSVVAAVEKVDFAVQLEVICVDDGSTDGTGALLDAYAEQCRSEAKGQRSGSGVTVIHQPNGGEGSARNAGQKAATGEWISYLDGDDVWLPPILASFAETERRHPDVDIIGFRFLPFDDGGPVPQAQAAKSAEVEFDVREEIPSEAVLDLGVFPTFFRRERFRDVSFSTLTLGADRLYVAECLAKAERIVLSPAGVHGYRVRAGSMARAEWNERKIRSMVDFAAGSLKAFTASGKRLGRRGARYLGDVLFSVTPKKIRRMKGDKTSVRAHWLDALATVDSRVLSVRHRLMRLCRLPYGACKGQRAGS